MQSIVVHNLHPIESARRFVINIPALQRAADNKYYEVCIDKCLFNMRVLQEIIETISCGDSGRGDVGGASNHNLKLYKYSVFTLKKK